MVEEILRTEQLSRHLEGEVPITLVDNASLTVKRGEFTVITGPSGSGKSSLLYLLGLLDTPSSGRLWFSGVDTSSYDETKLADLRLSEIGFVFQFHFLLPEFTAIENVMLPMQRLGRLSNGELRERARELLITLGLEKELNKRPKQLSGGQSQRVAVARALANDPLLILADEPTGNLDSVSSMAVSDILRKLTDEHNRAVLAVTHDQNFAKLADTTISIVDGKIESHHVT